MARLSKAQIRAHEQASELLDLPSLDDDQRQFVLDNWQESARHVNSAAGAFFTPSGLALDAAIYAVWTQDRPVRVLDLCAGIGALGLSCWWRSNRTAEVTCVEINPDYVAVGRKLFPEARWVEASVSDLPADLGEFDVAISNPPFGKTAKIKGPRYSGEDDLAVVDIASDLARWGVFILPGMSCPFEYSGVPHYRLRQHPAKFERFHRATGIDIQCESIDCSYYQDQWRGVSPNVEVVTAGFEQVRAARAVARIPDLFEEAA